MFFHLSPKAAFINDLNPHLFNLYTQVRDNVEELILRATELLDIYLELDEDMRPAYYYVMRDEFNQKHDDDAWGAALFLFLNKTCYNGVYRENNKHEFNVPHGKRKSIPSYDLSGIRKASETLQHTKITNRTYSSALDYASAGDFVYLDPPYAPISTSSFTQYTGSDFDISEQVSLKETFELLDKRGCLIMMSNSSTDLIKDLYSDYRKVEVQADRAVNCKAHGRGKIAELVVMNY